MIRWKMLWLALGASLAPGMALASGPAGSAPLDELAAQVRAAETAFARTMADRNHEAFASFVADEALFFGRQGVLRGKAAVAAGWKPFFEGEKAPFSWAVEGVEVLDSGTLALSTGPVRDPEGKQIGTFNSIWRREADGRWRVVFDKGCPVCEPAKKP
jgi:ketosteroid isomerase-like protein